VQIVVDITLRSDGQKGFEVVPWRWVVERSFAWLGAYRRLSKDYVFFIEHSEGMIYLASIHRLWRRLAPAECGHLYASLVIIRLLRHGSWKAGFPIGSGSVESKGGCAGSVPVFNVRFRIPKPCNPAGILSRH
jgi:putative transposase